MTYLSVCSGIEACSVAWEPLGWEAAAFAEIEPFPSAVLAHHWPGVPNLGDLTQYHDWPTRLRELGRTDRPDLIVGGTPCQSFSVAGLRRGLADPRGNLTLVFLGLLARMRPRWVVWENVPGVLSDRTGAFGALLGGLGELGYGFAYRVLDAQYFGVAQRRRRVFVVGHLGDWRRAAAVLFEPAGLRGDPAPRRDAGERAATRLAAGTRGGGGLGTDCELDGGLIPEVANPLTARMHKGINTTMDEGQTMIAHALRGECFDASEDGTGRGTPIVPVHTTGAGFWQEGFGTLRGREQDSHENLVAFRACGQDGFTPHSHVAPPVCASDGGNAGMPCVAFSCKDHGADASDLSPTLRSMGHDGSHANGGGQVAVAFNLRGRDGGAMPEVDPDGLACQRAASGGSSRSYVATSAVRRLTPTECERLQGFPDGHTRIAWRGKAPEDCPDGPRYKALGNSMAVPVMRWIGQRIALVESLYGTADFLTPES